MTPCIVEILKLHATRLKTSLGLDQSSARIEVQCLLQAVLQVNRAYLLTYPEKLLTDAQSLQYSALLERRLNGEPLAYILGTREFFGLDFIVSPATLIPRPDTELLVELALQRIPLPLVGEGGRQARRGGRFRVLDMGTGSGAIALSIAHARPDVEVVAVDASADALDIARENLQRLNLANVRLLHSDWFAALPGERFDLIVSNPPYIAADDPHLAQGDLRFEPRSALAAGLDGLEDIRTIVAQARLHLKSEGSLLFEHGYNQAEPVRALLQHAGFSDVFSTKDISGIERVSGGTWSALTDTMGRELRDLRISVTDRCNLRCTYCMPREIFDQHHVFLPRTELLSFEEITRLAKLFVGQGVQKIRLTGGEPLLRRGIEQLVEKLASLKTPQGKPVEIAMTTNGVLLATKALALKRAGLSRVTVSLDSLNDETFRKMSDSTVPVQTVLDGIAAAQAAGFDPVKVNMVVQRGVNDHEVLLVAEHFRNTGVVLRFIEYMDVGSSNGWKLDEVVSARQILAQIASRHPIQAVDADYPGEVAERWRYKDGGGEIGVIASITQAFCHSCSRARLSTDGKLYTCLFASSGLDLRGPLRLGVDDHALTGLIASSWGQRADRYSQLRHEATDSTALPKIEMSYIGG